ncbi:hypothetical protein DESUT3_17100 [Desulfuromonas versatilis]|uniref:Dystroglycan-type cadherin-like domain-containing protein n=1 Tax=Desulfuromonas versatilis TaxID=2802975 RepID=A0ABM7NC48_9BACT|nr:putative Ig domain-containing protein [Desulfuromonas versatilis]BCR04641.1 hypothetical protein DESUT3_17100 [Desulfuromonas versatilis]
MIGMKNCAVCLGLISLLSIAPGCGKSGESQTESAKASSSEVPVVSSPPGSLSVSIQPDRPTASRGLRAVVSGVAGQRTYRWKKNGVLIAGASEAALPGDNFKKGDLLEVSVDAGELTGAAQVVIDNSPPKIRSLPFSPAYVCRGQDLVVAPEVEDMDGDPISLTFTWSINGEEHPWEKSSTLPGEVFKRGDRISLAVVASDPEGEGPVFKSGEIEVGNAPPKFVSNPPRELSSSLYSYRAVVEDPDGDAVSYSLEAAPQGMEIDQATGQLLWAIGPEHTGEHSVKIKATDSLGMWAAQEFSLSITFGDQL